MRVDGKAETSQPALALPDKPSIAVLPFINMSADTEQEFNGPDTTIAGSRVSSFALLLHEFATNAAKYGAFSVPTGRVEINCFEEGKSFVLKWTERGGPVVDHQPDIEGFGSLLSRMTVKGQLGGEISHEWRPEGLTIRLTVPRNRLAE